MFIYLKSSGVLSETLPAWRDFNVKDSWDAWSTVLSLHPSEEAKSARNLTKWRTRLTEWNTGESSSDDELGVIYYYQLSLEQEWFKNGIRVQKWAQYKWITE